MMWPEEQQTNQPIQSHRRVGDKYTWTIPLDISTVQRSQTPDYVLEHACFRISNAEKTWQDAVAESLGIVYYVMTAGQYTSHALQYTYTHDYSAWVDFLGERTDLLTGLELRKMDPMDRPLHYDEIIDRPNYSDPIYKPPEWTYWDSEIQNWYKAWVAESAAQRKIREERKSRRIRGH